MSAPSWNDADDIGIASVDAQHREMFRLLNALTTPDSTAAALDRFIIFAREHFAHEEALFENTGYADAERHRTRHRHLNLILSRFAQSFANSPQPIEPLCAFLTGWLMDHIRGDDRAFARHLQSKAGERAVLIA